MAIFNLRFLDAGVAKVQTEGETNKKVLRRAMGTKSVTRLGVITAHLPSASCCSTVRSVSATVAGLVIFQLLFVVNVGRVLISQGIQ